MRPGLHIAVALVLVVPCAATGADASDASRASRRLASCAAGHYARCTDAEYSRDNCHAGVWVAGDCRNCNYHAGSKSSAFYEGRDPDGCERSCGKCCKVVSNTFLVQDSLAGHGTCTACPAGKFQESAGSPYGCAECGTGQYADTNATSTCKRCPSGKYADQVGQTACKPCAAGRAGHDPRVPWLELREKNFADARAHCQAHGSDLMQIRDSADLSAAAAFLSIKRGFLLGITDVATEGTWRNLDGSLAFTLWNDGEPNNAHGGEHYVEMTHHEGRMNDFGGARHSFLCAGSVNGPTTTCRACPAGQHQSNTGQTVCQGEECPAGKFVEQIAQTVPVTCKSCGVGQYNNETAQVQCKSCRGAGAYQDVTGQVACKGCSAGMYKLPANVLAVHNARISSASGSTPQEKAGNPLLCIDGNLGGQIDATQEASGQMCHSEQEENAWLRLDLQGVQHVNAVKIYNRDDAYSSRFGAHVIELSDDAVAWTVCFTGTLPSSYGPHEEPCVGTGSYVRLRMIHSEYLNLFEVQVLGGSSSAACQSCATGQYQNEAGQSRCRGCVLPGHYQDESGQSTCKGALCEAGTSVTPCAAVTFTTVNDARCADSPESPGPFNVAGFGDLPQSCHSSTTSSCTIHMCNTDTITVTAKTDNAWLFKVSVDGEEMEPTSVCAPNGEWACCGGTWLQTDQQLYPHTTTSFAIPGPKSRVTCKSCGAGKYQSQKGRTVCDMCPGGQYQDQDAQASCKACAAGRYGQYGDAPCGVATEENPPESSRKYSSVWDGDAVGTGSARSRLDSEQAWSAGALVLGQWAQLDLGRVAWVAGIVTQARKKNTVDEQFVKTLKVDTSADEKAWAAVESGTIFPANTAAEFAEDSAKRALIHFAPVPARFVRIFPQAWSQHMSMRFGAIVTDCSVARAGCKACPIGQYQDQQTAQQCFDTVSKSNWFGGDTYNDTFRITFNATSGQTCATRTDSALGWGMNLRFRCSTATPLCAIGNSTLHSTGSPDMSSLNTKCVQCGVWWPVAGTSCIGCAAGHYSPAATVACQKCTAGRFQEQESQQSCKGCALNLFTQATGSLTCTRCAEGQYADTHGSSTCKSCAEATAVGSNAASDSGWCHCKISKQRNTANKNDGFRCVECEDGHKVIDGVCTRCTPEYIGYDCANCNKNYYRSGKSVCVRCPDDNWVLPTLACVGFLAICRLLYTSLKHGARFEEWSMFFSHAQIVSVLVSNIPELGWPPLLAQLMDQLRKIVFLDFLSYVQPECVMPLGAEQRFLMQAAMPLILVVVFSLIYVWHRCSGLLCPDKSDRDIGANGIASARSHRHQSDREVRNFAIQAFLVALNAIYANLAVNLSAAWKYDDMGPDKGYRWALDAGEKEAPEWIQWVARGSLVVWYLLVPALILWYLLRHDRRQLIRDIQDGRRNKRSSITDSDGKTQDGKEDARALSCLLGFFFARYRPGCWWFELFQMACRVAIAVVANCNNHNGPSGLTTQWKALILGCVMLFSLILTVVLRPYRDEAQPHNDDVPQKETRFVELTINGQKTKPLILRVRNKTANASPTQRKQPAKDKDADNLESTFADGLEERLQQCRAALLFVSFSSLACGVEVKPLHGDTVIMPNVTTVGNATDPDGPSINKTQYMVIAAFLALLGCFAIACSQSKCVASWVRWKTRYSMVKYCCRCCCKNKTPPTRPQGTQCTWPAISAIRISIKCCREVFSFSRFASFGYISACVIPAILGLGGDTGAAKQSAVVVEFFLIFGMLCVGFREVWTHTVKRFKEPMDFFKKRYEEYAPALQQVADIAEGESPHTIGNVTARVYGCDTPDGEGLRNRFRTENERAYIDIAGHDLRAHQYSADSVFMPEKLVRNNRLLARESAPMSDPQLKSLRIPQPSTVETRAMRTAMVNSDVV